MVDPEDPSAIVCLYCHNVYPMKEAEKQGRGWACVACDLITVGLFLGVPQDLLSMANKWAQDRLIWAIQLRGRGRAVHSKATIMQ